MNLRENPIYLSGRQRPSRRLSLSQVATVLFVLLVMAVNYYVFLREDPSPPPPSLEKKINTRPEPVPQRTAPAKPAVPEEELPGVPEGGAVLAGELKRGQTLLSALGALGVPTRRMLPYIHEMERVFDFRKARVGDEFKLVISQDAEIKELFYTTSPLDRYQVAWEEGELVAIKRAVPIQVDVVEVGCAVKSSIFESFKRCGERSTLASRFVDLLAWDVDFFRDVRKGDEVRMLVEKKSTEDGTFVGYGDILAAEYSGKFGRQRFFWFEDPDGEATGYYKEDGKAARKQFIKTPLKFTRISSGYTHRRKHPVLHTYKKHLAIDYAAPTGTPVWSVAGGTVSYAGKKGASGNLVAIKHANGYTSYYAHLNSFAKGIEVGARVDQKTTIGTVGMTGRTTGPHLHFALKHKGRFVNPQTVKYTTANPVPMEHLGEYKEAVDKHLERLSEIKVIGIDDKKA